MKTRLISKSNLTSISFLLLAFATNLLLNQYTSKVIPEVDIEVVSNEPMPGPVELFPGKNYPSRLSPINQTKVFFENTKIPGASFRLDFGNEPNLVFNILEVKMRGPGGSDYTFSHLDLFAKIQSFGLETNLTASTIQLITRTSDSQIIVPNPFVYKNTFVRNGVYLVLLIQSNLNNSLTLVFFALCFIILISLKSSRILYLLLLFLTLIIVIVPKPFLPKHSTVVGKDVFFGYSQHEASFILLMIMFVAFLILFIGVRTRPIIDFVETKMKGRSTSLFNLLLATIAFVNSVYSPLNPQEQLMNRGPVNNWDSSNIEYWRVLIANGLQPNGDFLYPYENLFFIERWQPVSNIIYACLVFFVLFSLLSCIPFSNILTISLKLLFVASILVFPANSIRYLLPFALLYVVYLPTKSFRIFVVQVFGLTCLGFLSWVLFISLSVAYFASQLVQFFLFWSKRDVLRERFLHKFLVFFVATCFLVLSSYQDGSIMGRLELLRDGSEVLAFSSDSRSNGVFSSINIETLCIVITVVVGILALTRNLLSRTIEWNFGFLFSTFILLIILLQKHFVREMFDWLLPVLLFCLLFWSSSIQELRQIGSRRSFVLLISISFIFVHHFSLIQKSVLPNISHLPSYFSGYMSGKELEKKQAYERVLRSQAYQRQLWPTSYDAYSQIPMEIRENMSFLTNDASIYLYARSLDGIDVPWVSDLWLISTTSEQIRFISNAQRYRFIALDSVDSEIDGIGNFVRLPYITDWFFSNFDLGHPQKFGRYLVYQQSNQSTVNQLRVKLDYGRLIDHNEHLISPGCHLKDRCIEITFPNSSLSNHVVTLSHPSGANIYLRFETLKLRSKIRLPFWLSKPLIQDPRWIVFVDGQRYDVMRSLSSR